MQMTEEVCCSLWKGLSLNRVTKSSEIFMFVSKKMPNNAVKQQSSIVLTVSTIELCGITALFGIFLRDKQTSKYHESWAPFLTSFNTRLTDPEKTRPPLLSQMSYIYKYIHKPAYTLIL